ncbi:MAG: APC family permease [Anaerovoracaceae bacterium]|jgi:APA family basic amino acid/polyamine antiporter
MFEKRSRLTRVLGRTDIIALGFGTMVGWSWVVLTATWLTSAGFLGTITAFLVGALLILGVGLTYGELTAAFPLSGGEFVYAYRAGGRFFSWLVGWTMTLAYLGVAAWEAIAVSTAINYIIPLPSAWHLWDIAGYPVYFSWALVGILGAALVMVLNLFGTRPVIIFQVMATAAVMAMSIMLLLGGITFGGAENIGPSFTTPSGLFVVLLIIPSMLIGFDVIPQSAEEMNISPRNIGKMLIVCIIISVIWYLMVIIGVATGAPAEVRMSGELPVADVMAYLYGNDGFGTALIIVGILGIFTSWNGFFMGASRLIFAMGRARMLPQVFGRTGKRYQTPWAAILAIGSVCMITPLFGANALIWLVNISAICSLFTYCCVTLSFILLRKKEPDLHRPIKIRGGMGFGILVMIAVVLYFALYIVIAAGGNDYTFEAIAIVIWVAIGMVLFLSSAKSNRAISEREREILIFGEELARFIKGRKENE